MFFYECTILKCFTLKQFVHKLIWWTSLGFCVLGPFISTPEANNVGHLVKGVAIGTQHALWIACLGTMFYILSQLDIPDYVLPVKRFLSSSHWRPASRLSFCMYLTHQTPIWFSIYNGRAPFEVNVLNIVSDPQLSLPD